MPSRLLMRKYMISNMFFKKIITQEPIFFWRRPRPSALRGGHQHSYIGESCAT